MTDWTVIAICFALACIPTYFNYRARKAWLEGIFSDYDQALKRLVELKRRDIAAAGDKATHYE